MKRSIKWVRVRWGKQFCVSRSLPPTSALGKTQLGVNKKPLRRVASVQIKGYMAHHSIGWEMEDNRRPHQSQSQMPSSASTLG